MGDGKMSGNPDVPFDQDAKLFNRMVADLLLELQKRYPNKSEADLKQEAEKRVAREFYQPQ